MSATTLPLIAPSRKAETLVAFDSVSKSYDGKSYAVADLDLEIEEGEFLTLLGPSGSGKTTTLMMLAGFEEPDSGEISLRGESLTRRPPHKRNLGVVFQNYALFPHMTVFENLAFPLRVRGARGPSARSQVREALRLVQLEGLEDRRPSALSGGQQQRVALARALIFKPDIVLMDEPLGALDRQLREKLQAEIKRIHRQLGVTIVYVTHDQSEALTLSDRIAVFAEGRVQQLDDPQTVYDEPANAFVAGFVGENNLISGVVAERDGGRCVVRAAGGDLISAVPVGMLSVGDTVVATVRPEQIVVGADAAGMQNHFYVKVEDHIYHGDHTRIRARLPGGVEVFIRSVDRLFLDLSTAIGWSADHCFAFAASEAAE